MTKLISAVMTAPKSITVFLLPPMICQARPLTLVTPMDAISGLMMLVVKLVTTVVKATPMTTATARSTTLPRMMKFLKPWITRCPFRAVDNPRTAGTLGRRDHRGQPMASATATERGRVPAAAAIRRASDGGTARTTTPSSPVDAPDVAEPASRPGAGAPDPAEEPVAGGCGSATTTACSASTSPPALAEAGDAPASAAGPAMTSAWDPARTRSSPAGSASRTVTATGAAPPAGRSPAPAGSSPDPTPPRASWRRDPEEEGVSADTATTTAAPAHVAASSLRCRRVSAAAERRPAARGDGSSPRSGAANAAGRGTASRGAISRQVEGEGDAVERVPAAAAVVRRQGRDGGREHALEPLDAAAERRHHVGVGHALAGLEPGVQVGHDGDRRVAQRELAGDRRLRHPGHAHDVTTEGGVPARLRPRGEPWTVDHDQGSAVARWPARVHGRRHR